jgi:hypothetical protein
MNATHVAHDNVMHGLTDSQKVAVLDHIKKQKYAEEKSAGAHYYTGRHVSRTINFDTAAHYQNDNQ